MLNVQTPPPKQVLLRLPPDLAAKLARAVPPRRRNQFLVDLVRLELEKEDAEMVSACEAMNALEAAHPELVLEAKEWAEPNLAGSVDDWDPDFDREAFEREFAIAQAPAAAAKPISKRAAK